MPVRVDLCLPGGECASIPVQDVRLTATGAVATVVKDAGDDPDVTDAARVEVTLAFRDGGDIEFVAGVGVGTITKPGLQLPPGEPAINPVPREMIRDAIRHVTSRAARVTISIPGGTELAEKTFNPRLGIEGGLSILGTTGIVRPFSAEALRQALTCALGVACATGHRELVMVPGNVGRRAAQMHLRVGAEQVVEVSNEWGYMLGSLADREVTVLMIVGHPGKLGKLPLGHWNTHSAASPSALPYVRSLMIRHGGKSVPEAATVGGLFDGQKPEARRQVGDALADAVRRAVTRRVEGQFAVCVMLVDYQATVLGTAGDTASWL